MLRTKKSLTPSYRELMEPGFKALVMLDGFVFNDEITEAIIKMLELEYQSA